MDFRAIEAKWQHFWATSKTFETDRDTSKEKFLITVPYPYISGSLHIGHARVVTEADVYSRYLRMKGMNVRFPMGFHISGTPVLGISLAIEQGDEKKIALYRKYVSTYIKDEEEVERIVQSFKDPIKIVEFFIPKMKSEFSSLGLGIDWRHSFTSGDAEHQALVEWQFKQYKKQNYLVQGKYPVLYSLTLQNAVGEDDIADGDTNPVEKQEFTLIKFKKGNDILVAATLRPETMFGQTNLWVNPNTTYVRIKVNDEQWICSKPCAEKLKHQDRKVTFIENVPASELIGSVATNAVVKHKLPILPATFCDEHIGTGIVTSVPSHAPFDWIGLRDLQNNKEECEKYGLNQEDIQKIEPIALIKVKGWKVHPAEEICKRDNITSQKETEKLEAAKKEIYKAEFHTGVMMDVCGEYAGMRVEEAKEAIKKQLIKDKTAEIFFETSRRAQSRDGGEVIVAIMDSQWFLDFEAQGWKDKAYECLKHMEILPDKYRKQFEDTFAWLTKRPCARKRGLGTQLPFDQNWVIESLSDSTMYMALYPIVQKMREAKMTKEQMTEEVFTYILTGKGDIGNISQKTNISEHTLITLREEFEYWYPVDHRHTFQAHLPNHLSFMIFAHTATLEKQFWPKKISFHGMVISEGQKMSKSKGNVISLLDVKNTYGADTFRSLLCYSTSVDSTFDWSTDAALSIQKHLATIHATLTKASEKNTSKKNTIEQNAEEKVTAQAHNEKFRPFFSSFERFVEQATASLEKMDLRQYATITLYQINNAVKEASRWCKDEEEKLQLIASIRDKWTTLLAPLVPHLAEDIWARTHTKGESVSTASWPQVDVSKIDRVAEMQSSMVDTLRKDILTVLEIAKIEKPSKITIIMSNEWKYKFCGQLESHLINTRDFKELLKKLLDTELKEHAKQLPKLIQSILKDPGKLPSVLLTQEQEAQAVARVAEQLAKEFGSSVVIAKAEDTDHPKAQQAFPGKPALVVV